MWTGADEFVLFKETKCIFKTVLAEGDWSKCPSHGKEILPVVMQESGGRSFHLSSPTSPFTSPEHVAVQDAPCLLFPRASASSYSTNLSLSSVVNITSASQFHTYHPCLASNQGLCSIPLTEMTFHSERAYIMHYFPFCIDHVLTLLTKFGLTGAFIVLCFGSHNSPMR